MYIMVRWPVRRLVRQLYSKQVRASVKADNPDATIQVILNVCEIILKT